MQTDANNEIEKTQEKKRENTGSVKMRIFQSSELTMLYTVFIFYMKKCFVKAGTLFIFTIIDF